jgi:outer membrane protein
MRGVTLLFLIALNLSGQAATLDEAFRSALQKNESVGQQRELTHQAEERLKQARSGPLPTLALEATHLIQPLPKNEFAREFFPEKQTTIDAALTQPLFRGFREFAALRQQKAFYQSAEQTEVSYLLSLYGTVAANYLDILFLEQDLKNLEEQRGTYSVRSKELTGRTRRGESQRNEALTAQATEASTVAEINLTRALLRSARQNFAYLTGLPAETPLHDPESEKALTLKPLEFYLGRLTERPDVKSAVEQETAFREEVKIAKGQHWPSLDVTGRYYFRRPDGFYKDVDWDVQFNAKWPLFEGGLRLAQTREASSKQRQASLELSRLRRQAESEIKSLYENLKMRDEQLKALKRSSELAQQSAQVLQRDFKRGLTRNVDVQVALTESAAIKRRYDQARFGARVDKIRLDNAAALYPAAIEGRVK